MGRLQSGHLLFETPEGLVRVELTFKERVALLWTFRNFRRLSTPLLNSRENTLINTLYRTHAGVISASYDPSAVIGVVEDFVPSMENVAQEMVSPIAAEKSVLQKIVSQKIVDKKIDAPLAPRKERRERAVERTEMAPVSAAPRIAWSTVAMARFAATRLAAARFVTARLAGFKFAMSPRVMSRTATAIGGLSLCIVSVVAWHRIEAVPGSQAHNRPEPEQVSSLTLASAPMAEPVAAPAEAPAPAAALVADPDAPLKPVTISPTTISPTTISAAVPVAAIPVAAAPAPVLAAAAPATMARAIVPNPKRTTRVHAVSTATVPLSSQDRGIQATRPPLRYVYPDYSDVQSRGVVALTAELDSEGKVRAVKVVTGNRALAAAAIRAVRQWRYRPYLKDGQAVATETNIQISFISNDAISMTFPPNIPATR